VRWTTGGAGPRWTADTPGRRLTGERPKRRPRVRNLSAVEEKGGGDGSEPHRLQEGVAEGRTRPGDGEEQSTEEVLGGVDVADSRASKLGPGECGDGRGLLLALL
jgi:hypothetical protein